MRVSGPFFIVAVSAVIMFSLAVVVLRSRHKPGALSFAVMMVAGGVYALFYSLELAVEGVDETILFYQLQYLGIPFIPVSYLLFSLGYAGKERVVWYSRLAVLVVVPLVVMVLALTLRWHEWFVRDVRVDTDARYPVVWFSSGFGYLVHQAYSILLLVVGMLVVLRVGWSSKGSFRSQANWLMCGAVIPFIVYIAYMAGFQPAGLDPIPFAFALAGIAIYFGLTRSQLFDLTPLARDQLLEQLPDIVMVFDGVGRLVDYNQAAGRVFRLAPSVIGVRGDLALGDWPVLLEALDGGGGDVGVRQVGVSLPIEGKARKFEGYVYLLAGRDVGMAQILLLRDVTPAGRHGGDYFKEFANGRSGRAARFAKRGLGGNVDQKWCWIHVEDAGRVGFP